MADTTIYGHLEMQRYLQHKMSPQEMHDFEKALMNDPFLADALDGFSASDPTLADKHITAIESAITGNQQTAKVVALPSRKTAWWKVAAITIVIISAGAITYSVVNNRGLVNTGQSQIAASSPETKAVEKDSIRPVDKPLARVDLLPGKKVLGNQNSSTPIIRNDEAGNVATSEKLFEAENKRNNESLADVSAQAQAQQQNELAAISSRKMSIAFMSNEFRGKVVDSTGEPLPFASIKANNNGLSTTSDDRGNFRLKAADSVLEVNVNSSGYASKTTKIKSNTPETKIVLKENEMSLSEIVVSMQQNKNKSVNPTIRVDTSNAAVPVGGLKNFEEYLSKQHDFIKGIESLQNIDHNIMLEFSIDQQGQPTNVTVPREMDKTTAEKTVEVLSNGPAWKNKKKDKKVKVIIEF